MVLQTSAGFYPDIFHRGITLTDEERECYTMSNERLGWHYTDEKTKTAPSTSITV